MALRDTTCVNNGQFLTQWRNNHAPNNNALILDNLGAVEAFQFQRTIQSTVQLNVPINQFRLFVANNIRRLFRRLQTHVNQLPMLEYDNPPVAKTFRLGLWRDGMAGDGIVTRTCGIRNVNDNIPGQWVTPTGIFHFTLHYFQTIYDLITELWNRMNDAQDSDPFFAGLNPGQNITMTIYVRYRGMNDHSELLYDIPNLHNNAANDHLGEDIPLPAQNPPEQQQNLQFLDDPGVQDLDYYEPPPPPPPRRSGRNRRPPGYLADYLGGRCKTLYCSINSCICSDFGVYINDDLESERCLPMAMMRAQRITYLYDDEYVCPTPTKAHYAVVEECGVGRDLFPQETFHPMSTARWIELSLEVHVKAIQNLQVLFHYNSLNQSVSAYAQAFQVNIHLFRVQSNYRIGVFRPSNRVKSHVIFLLDGTHLHPVDNIYKFVNSGNDLYCMHCLAQVKSTKWNQHIVECHNKQNPFGVSKYMHKFQKQVEVHDIYPKVRGLKQADMKCELCGIHTPQSNHSCYIPRSKIPDPLREDQLWVLDIEACQEIVLAEYGDKYQHVPVLICLANMYDETKKHEFYSELEFLRYLQAHPADFHDCTFIAHNGGGYDYQHFVRGCDELNIEYTFIPTPSSRHKYLQLDVFMDKYHFRFIDFMRFVSGSLASIAKSFGLSDQKTHFPHRFLTTETLHYVGPLPPNDSQTTDYWCVRNMKSQEDVDEFEEWYNSYSSTSNQWDLYRFMVEYCWMDVKVLAAACREFREGLLHPDSDPEFGWSASPIDPFCFMTQSQMAMCLFLAGFTEHPKIYLTVGRYRASFSHKQIFWLEMEASKIQCRIQHLGNSEFEYVLTYSNIVCDGFCHQTTTVYDFVTCAWEGCPKCQDPNKMNKTRHILNRTCWKQREDKVNTIRRLGYQFVEVYECEWDQVIGEFSLEQKAEMQHVGEVYNDREIFYGGRTEVFSPFVHSERIQNKDQLQHYEIKYHDVCSLYPTVCSHDRLPTGKPAFVFGDNIEFTRVSPNHPHPYFGFIKCKVLPNPNDPIGLLPRRLSEESEDGGVNGLDQGGKLVFDLHEKVGFWATCELHLAIQHGYKILQVYQVIHFDKEECLPIMKGYMSYFLRQKQENEGWKKLGLVGEETDDKKEELIEQLFTLNGNMGRIRKNKVTKNPVVRHVSKLFLNCLWGKFGQRRICDAFMDVHNYEDLEGLMYYSGLQPDKIHVRQTKSGIYKAQCTKEYYATVPNKKSNIYLAAMVTAQARCRLHSQMFRLGPENIVYCDTDSIVWLRNPRIELPFNMRSSGLGQWVDEHPTEKIKIFVAAAPKMYMLIYDEDQPSHNEIKAKGICLTLENKNKLTLEEFQKALYFYKSEKQLQHLQLYNMTIYPNTTDGKLPYAQMMTRYNLKKFSAVISKRNLQEDTWRTFEEELEEYDMSEWQRAFDQLSRLRTFPLGYNNN